MLDVQGLSKAYGSHQALDAVNLEVAAGEITALLGRNGAGKTRSCRSSLGYAARIPGVS